MPLRFMTKKNHFKQKLLLSPKVPFKVSLLIKRDKRELNRNTSTDP